MIQNSGSPQPKRASTQFSFITGVALVLLACAVILVYRGLISYGASDIREYRELLQASDAKHAESASQPYSAAQQHRKAQKDIWYTSTGQRLHAQISSADTELVLDHHDHQTAIIEDMHDVICYMQEAIYYQLPNGREVIMTTDGQLVLRGSNPEDPSNVINPDRYPLTPMQLIRYLEADSAVYTYQKSHLKANKVKLARYIAPGHTLPTSLDGMKLLMQGTARSAEFSVNENGPHFTAYEFKANLHTPVGALP